MSVQLVGRQGHAMRSGGSFRLTPFGGVSIEPVRPARPQAGVEVIDQAAFDELLRLMPNLEPELVEKIMGVVVRREGEAEQASPGDAGGIAG